MMPTFGKPRIASVAVLLFVSVVTALSIDPQPAAAQYGAVTCNNGGTCSAGPVSVTVPAGSLPTGDTLVVFPPPAGTPMPAAAAGTVLVGDPIVVEVHDSGGQVVTPITLTPPLEICMKYTPDQLAIAGGNPANLLIRYYDKNAGQWVTAGAANVDSANNQVCTSVSHLTEFALFGKTPATLPVTGGGADLPRSLLLLGAELFAVFLIVLGAALMAPPQMR